MGTVPPALSVTTDTNSLSENSGAELSSASLPSSPGDLDDENMKDQGHSIRIDPADVAQYNKSSPEPIRYHDIINFGRQTKTKARRRCVMCSFMDGSICDVGLNVGALVQIPTQNKDVCKLCDKGFWLCQKTEVVVKFCKGCKNFTTLSEFLDKPDASKCASCRDRGRQNYFSRKKIDPEKRQAESTPGGLVENSSSKLGGRSRKVISPHRMSPPSHERVPSVEVTQGSALRVPPQLYEGKITPTNQALMRRMPQEKMTTGRPRAGSGSSVGSHKKRILAAASYDTENRIPSQIDLNRSQASSGMSSLGLADAEAGKIDSVHRRTSLPRGQSSTHVDTFTYGSSSEVETGLTDCATSGNRPLARRTHFPLTGGTSGYHGVNLDWDQYGQGFRELGLGLGYSNVTASGGSGCGQPCNKTRRFSVDEKSPGSVTGAVPIGVGKLRALSEGSLLDGLAGIASRLFEPSPRTATALGLAPGTPLSPSALHMRAPLPPSINWPEIPPKRSSPPALMHLAEVAQSRSSTPVMKLPPSVQEGHPEPSSAVHPNALGLSTPVPRDPGSRRTRSDDDSPLVGLALLGGDGCDDTPPATDRPTILKSDTAGIEEQQPSPRKRLLFNER